MEWKYVKNINENEIVEVEKKYNINLPESLKNIILKYNGGRPDRRIFDTATSKERVIKSLISYSDKDKENIHIFSDFFKRGYIPFAITPFGDVLCMKKGEKIYILMHETDEFDYVCNNLDEFFKKLYK